MAILIDGHFFYCFVSEFCLIHMPLGKRFAPLPRGLCFSLTGTSSMCRRWIGNGGKRLCEELERRSEKDDERAFWKRHCDGFGDNGKWNAFCALCERLLQRTVHVTIITNARSGKVGQIKKEPRVALAGEWFTAHGMGIDLGYFGKEENRGVAEKLKQVFSQWIDNGHNDLGDENTIILCVKLTDGILLSHGTRYEF